MNNYTSQVSAGLLSFYAYSRINEINTFYVDPITGLDNVTATGSGASPFRTFLYAASRVTNPGMTIFLNAGVHEITAQVNVSEGVSLKGAGRDKTFVRITTAIANPIYLSSPAEGADGRQSIEDINFDAQLTATNIIYISGRSNVKIRNCYFQNAVQYGVTFRGKVDATGGDPGIFATGNEVVNTTFYNCARYLVDGRGNLEFSGQQGFCFYNSVIIQPDRGTGSHGYGIKCVINSGRNIGTKILNSHIEVPVHQGAGFPFAIEMWDSTYTEIAHCRLVGSLDMGGHWSARQGNYKYALSIHHNEIGFDVQTKYENVTGIYLEGDTELTYIYKNKVKNSAVGISFNPVTSASDIAILGRNYHIYKDIFIFTNQLLNIGVNDAGAASKGWGVYFLGDANTHTIDNLMVCNNVVRGDTNTTSTMWGLGLPAIGTATNIEYSNNIVENFDYAPVFGSLGTTGAATVDILRVRNNCYNGNGNGNVIRYGAGFLPTNDTITGSLIDNPDFVNPATDDYHLQAVSPCINAGVNIFGINDDYEDKPLDALPSIGIYNY